LLQFPAEHIPGIPIQDRHQVEPARLEPDIRNVNGMIANDKFCMIRTGRLHLRARPGALQRYDQRQPPSNVLGTLPEHHAHPGGTDETTLESNPPVSSLSGRNPTLGPDVPVSAPVDKAR
jgi:hypothetical protein